MGAIRCDNENINPKYLFYLLRHKAFNNYLLAAISGANIRNLNSNILGAYQIPLPPINVQNEIVEKLDGFSANIEYAKYLIENNKISIEGCVSELWADQT